MDGFLDRGSIRVCASHSLDAGAEPSSYSLDSRLHGGEMDFQNPLARALAKFHMRVAVLMTAALIAACGGGGGDEQPAGANAPSGNRSPTISGNPSTSVMQGSSYSFTPTA